LGAVRNREGPSSRKEKHRKNRLSGEKRVRRRRGCFALTGEINQKSMMVSGREGHRSGCARTQRWPPKKPPKKPHTPTKNHPQHPQKPKKKKKHTIARTTKRKI